MNDGTIILIIDDSRDDQMLYRRALQLSGDRHYVIFEAQDGEQGLAVIEKVMPDCVLLDYSLPGQDGVEVLKRIREQHPFLSVVMLTGQGNEKIAVAAMQQGAQNYIVKSSITPQALEHVIRMATEHCRLQKRIHEQRTSLEVFTRALAHDLNEPVRTIRSFVELIGQMDLPEKGRNYVKHVQSAADRMRMLIDTVFLYTRLDDPGQMPREICDMHTVLQEAQANLGQLIAEHRAIIVSDALPQVYASRTQLMQVLQNLISNAIHHSDNPVTVRISAGQEGNHWLFRVTDNGPGIETAYLQKIFEPFKRMVHHEEPGAGLGLAICKKIIESHDGRIWCESSPGAGASFLFTLPKALPAAPSADHQAPSVQPASPAHCVLGGHDRPLANVLLVDDSRAFIEMAQFELVERSGLQCNLMIARDGEEALSKLHSDTPIDLMLLDINMPEMDGFEVLEQMKRSRELERVSVVMCTGSDYDKDMEKARALGANGYILKPIEFDRLKSVIDRTPNIQLCESDSGYSLLRVA